MDIMRITRLTVRFGRLLKSEKSLVFYRNGLDKHLKACYHLVIFGGDAEDGTIR